MALNNPFCNLASLEAGQSSSETAKSGVDVVFEEECPDTPKIFITPHRESRVWTTAVSTTGFTWQSDEDSSTIDWVAIIRNG